MPIYEYRCQDCGRRLAVFWRSLADVKSPTCQRCGSDKMARLVSKVRVLRSEDSRMEEMTDDAMLADLDENDPRSLGRWMRKMSQEMGEDLGPEFDEIVGRQGKTVFLATHNLKEVEEIGHRMAFIHEGKIKACGTLGELSHIIEAPDRYVVCLKMGAAGPLRFLEKLQQRLKEDAEIKVLGQKAEGHEMEITINKKKELGLGKEPS